MTFSETPEQKATAIRFMREHRNSPRIKENGEKETVDDVLERLKHKVRWLSGKRTLYSRIKAWAVEEEASERNRVNDRSNGILPNTFSPVNLNTANLNNTVTPFPLSTMSPNDNLYQMPQLEQNYTLPFQDSTSYRVEGRANTFYTQETFNYQSPATLNAAHNASFDQQLANHAPTYPVDVLGNNRECWSYYNYSTPSNMHKIAAQKGCLSNEHNPNTAYGRPSTQSTSNIRAAWNPAPNSRQSTVEENDSAPEFSWLDLGIKSNETNDKPADGSDTTDSVSDGILSDKATHLIQTPPKPSQHAHERFANQSDLIVETQELKDHHVNRSSQLSTGSIVTKIFVRGDSGYWSLEYSTSPSQNSWHDSPEPTCEQKPPSSVTGNAMLQNWTAIPVVKRSMMESESSGPLIANKAVESSLTALPPFRSGLAGVKVEKAPKSQPQYCSGRLDITLPIRTKISGIPKVLSGRRNAPSTYDLMSERVALHVPNLEYTCIHSDRRLYEQLEDCSTCGFSEIHCQAAFPKSSKFLMSQRSNSSSLLDMGRGKLDRYNNTVLHYLSSSGYADITTLLAFHDVGANFFAKNTFGESSLHVLSPASLSGKDLSRLLMEIVKTTSHQSLAQSRDIYGRTILHALTELSLPLSVLKEILTCNRTAEVAPWDDTSPILQDLLNKRDSFGYTPAHRIFTRALQAVIEAAADESTSSEDYIKIKEAQANYRNVVELLNANGARNYQFRQIRDPVPATTDESEEMLQIIMNAEKSRREILTEHRLGRNIIHCLAYVVLDPATRLEKLKWALNARIYDPSANANVGIDVNSFDIDGNTPLHTTIIEASRREKAPELVTIYLVQIVAHFGKTINSLGDLLSTLNCHKYLPSIQDFVKDRANDWGMVEITSVFEFLERLRDWETKDRVMDDKNFLTELLQKNERKAHSKRLSVDEVAQRKKALKSVKRRSQYNTRSESINLIEVYINNGADIDIRDRQGRSPLYLACHLGLPGFTEALLKHGANVHARDSRGIGIISSAMSTLKKLRPGEDGSSIARCIALVRATGGIDNPSSRDEFFAWCKECGKHRHVCRHVPQDFSRSRLASRRHGLIIPPGTINPTIGNEMKYEPANIFNDYFDPSSLNSLAPTPSNSESVPED